MTASSWMRHSVLLSFLYSLTQALPGNGPWQSWGACKETKIRKEWSQLEPAERKAFTDAELCLQSKPSRLDPKYNSRSYYDDFVAVHINQTLQVHTDGIFLPWHREYIHLFEQALMNECGWQGTLPYWNWPLWASSLSTSPLFDGSEYSLSGDGYPNGTAPVMINQAEFPHGSGGGCVMSGPFTEYTVIYGYLPFSDIFVFNGILPPSVFDVNERCFNRDLNTYVATNLTSQHDVDVLLASTTAEEFIGQLDVRMQGNPPIGVHIGGHFSTGTVLGDFFASPADPVFWLHHSQIDRIWTQWQLAGVGDDRIYGANALSGGSTTLNIPPSPNVTLDYVLNWNILGGEKTIRETINVENYCYQYT